LVNNHGILRKIDDKNLRTHLEKLTIIGINQKLKYFAKHIILLAWDLDIP